MREVITTFFGFRSLGQCVLREAGLAPARALQNSSSVESMSFGKVHSAQEPSKTEGFVASTLESSAVTHAEWEGGGPGSRQASAPRWAWARARSGARPLPTPGPAGTVCVLWGASSCDFVRAQTPSLVRKGSVPTELWIK